MKLNQANLQCFSHCSQELLQNQWVRELSQFPQHGSLSRLEHCTSVAYYSLWLSQMLHIRVNRESLILGAMLHDFFFYNWYDKSQRPRFHGVRHAGIALQNAEQCFILNDKERNMILAHMWPLSRRMPHSKEALLICFIDKCCCIRELILTLKYKVKKKSDVSHPMEPFSQINS